MALDINLEVKNLPSALVNASYLVINSDWETVQSGTINVDIDGVVNIILSTTTSLSEFEAVLVVITDYDGNNYTTAGVASDFIKVSEIYKDFSVFQKGYLVECDNRTLAYTPWNMGDGVILDEGDPVYIYLSNGTYTISNADFSEEVTITGVTEFSVTLDGNVINGVRQTGFFGDWFFGNGDTSNSLNASYKFYENGTYLIGHDDFSVEVVLNYYTDIIESVTANIVTFFRPNGGTEDIDYGDGTTGQELVHEYAQHGIYEPKIGELNGVVEVEAVEIPTASISALATDTLGVYTIIPYSSSSSVSYELVINAESFYVEYGETLTYDFYPYGQDYYELVVKAIDVAGNVAYNSTTLLVQLENEPPTLTINDPIITGLDVTFNATVADSAGETVSLYWDLGNSSGAGSSTVFTYSYLVSGTYTVTCTATDNRSPAMSTTKTIEVTVSSESTVGENLLLANNENLVNMVSDSNSIVSTFNMSKSFSNNVLIGTHSKEGSVGRLEFNVGSLGMELEKSYRFSTRVKASTLDTDCRIDSPSMGSISYVSIDGSDKESGVIVNIPNDDEWHDCYIEIVCTNTTGNIKVYGRYSVQINSVSIQEVTN